MTKRWPKVWGAVIGFVLLGLRVTWSDFHWWDDRPGYVIGTFIGSGAIGALAGWFICALQNRRVAKREADSLPKAPNI